ncbi:MAG TPA: type II CAAX endopeptidase family protein [Candidatus Binatia bacterium]|nr:type II CAAX endopeptidase family protein [Candidatus Binatia bacterium]
MEDRPQNTDDQLIPHDMPPVPEFKPALQPSYARTLFYGPEGLRPGWGLAFYSLLFYGLQLAAVRWVGTLHWGILWSMTLEECGVLIAALAPAFLMARVEKRKFGSYGLPLNGALGKLFWTGAAWGFAAITLLMVLLYGLHAFDFGHFVLHGGRIIKFAVFWGAFFLLVGLFEEFLLRGYMQFTLTRAAGFWPAALLLSCAFGLMHLQNSGEQWPGLVAVFVIGLFFCLTLRRTGNLWFGVGFHMAWDWGETFFYSVPDSGTMFPGHLLKSSLHGSRWLTGGPVGPEGSALCFLVIAIAAVAFSRRYPEIKYRRSKGQTPSSHINHA